MPNSQGHISKNYPENLTFVVLSYSIYASQFIRTKKETGECIKNPNVHAQFFFVNVITSTLAMIVETEILTKQIRFSNGQIATFLTHYLIKSNSHKIYFGNLKKDSEYIQAWNSPTSMPSKRKQTKPNWFCTNLSSQIVGYLDMSLAWDWSVT